MQHSLGFRNRRDDARFWRKQVQYAYLAAIPPCSRAANSVDRSALDPERQRLKLRFESGAESDALFIFPTSDKPLPAVLMLHDHGGEFDIGWQKMSADSAGRHWVDRYYGGVFAADRLAAQGFAVLVVDAFGWGSRYAGGFEAQQANAANAMQLGWSLAGIVASEDVQAARWLAQQDGVDPNRVASWGFSFGAFRAWQVAALCPDIKASVSIAWMARRHGLMLEGNKLLLGQSYFYMLHPSLTGALDFPDMAGAGAGKPLFMRCGDADPLFPAQSVVGAYQDLSDIWADFDAKVDCTLFTGGHECSPDVQDQAARFLARCM
ncbi:dienelactone hydrolase family protein [Qingshengfaniella alkalisoli]|nr:dienelactone hydrolase family protein [Qingshengfaniella alkalisoli]